ncbi:MAG: molybdopterin-dependent oxidoreductase [Candidatus Aminicenantes bacterium]|nr:molybdopterin-dependent oxidoreductase [Candidatus Aminicenantes bacterium]
MSRKEPRTLTMEMDRRKIYFPEGVTVHRAAELNGVYIPSLCSHKDLSPFGGCRLCMVEIEGMRGYPLSCNTTAQEGMKVLTETPTLLELRKEFLKLILSEHPSSCLICDEKSNCQEYQGTIRKSGMTTGCRFCPNDGQCELQDLVDKLGVTDIDYPILYHGYEPEHDDPFYDRDYNLCILCGRCVRMCQEVRGTGVLAFTFRGPRAKVGPAFGRNHREAGCEFCGACVDVCPTGALADKASKWDGRPDGYHISTCPFCAIGCQIELSHKNRRLSKAKANLDPEVNDGQLCVKGRFCLPEVIHHFERAKRPMLQKGEYFREVAWPEALEKVGAELKGVRPDEIVMLVSPDLTNESLFAAQKFVRDCLGSQAIDSTARTELAGGLGLWSKLFSLPISIKAIAKSDVILAVGLDSRFDFSVVGTKVRQALDSGSKLVVIDPRAGNLARYTDDWLRPRPGMEGDLLKFFADRLAGRTADAASVARETSIDPADMDRALEILSSGKELTVILGPQVFHYGRNEALVDGLMTLAERKTANFIPLYFGANSRGALEMGVFPEVGPGLTAGRGTGTALADIISGSKRPKVLYLVGDIPFLERPDCEFLIVQDIYMPSFKVDAFLPASAFAEAGGTLINIEGRVQEVVQIEDLPEGAVTGFMRPDWLIFSDLDKALGGTTLNYHTAKDVQKDIQKAVPDFAAGNRKPRRMHPADHLGLFPSAQEKISMGDFVLVAGPGGYRHRGIDISSKVGGLNELALEEGFRMYPADIVSLGLKDGDPITLSIEHGRASATGPVRSDMECPRGAIYYTRPAVFGGLEHRREMSSFYRLIPNPIQVSVSKAGGLK